MLDGTSGEGFELDRTSGEESFKLGGIKENISSAGMTLSVSSSAGMTLTVTGAAGMTLTVSGAAGMTHTALDSADLA